jgi:hypothetical protein
MSAASEDCDRKDQLQQQTCKCSMTCVCVGVCCCVTEMLVHDVCWLLRSVAPTGLRLVMCWENTPSPLGVLQLCSSYAKNQCQQRPVGAARHVCRCMIRGKGAA